MRKYDQHKMSSSAPSNQVLHNENERKLEELLQLRKQQDQGQFQPISIPYSSVSSIVQPPTHFSITNPSSDLRYYPLSGKP